MHVGTGDGAGRALFDRDNARLRRVFLDHQRLDVQHDVGDIFQHAGDRGEFVLGPPNLDLGDGTAFQAGEQDPPQAVADGRAKAAFEWFREESAVGGGERFRFTVHDAGQFQTAPPNVHCSLR